MSGYRIHELKCWPASFEAISSGIKQFEIRKNDRDYQVGDYLRLMEWRPSDERYTGREERLVVTCIIQGQYGLPADLCVMGVKKL